MQTNPKKEIDGLESECEDKIKKLTDHIKSLQDDDSTLNSLIDAIFNCMTMEEIFEIQNLIKNHQLDNVVQRHLKTLQNLLLGLSYGSYITGYYQYVNHKGVKLLKDKEILLKKFNHLQQTPQNV